MNILTECNLAELVVELLNGKIVVFPTETSYGLGCDATNQDAVDKIFKIKGRRSDKPLLVVVPTVEMAKKYLVWNNTLEKIANKYWPGALTVVGAYRGSLASAEERAQGEVFLAQQASRNFSFERVKRYIKNLPLSRELRKNETKAEKILWSQLKNKLLGGLKFKRQHGIGSYIVDFYHPDTKTVIEIDGDIHFAVDKQEQHDRIRERWLKERGYKILRYNNVDIFNNLDGILKEIFHNLTTTRPLPAPSPRRRRGELATGVVSQNNTLAIRVTAHPLLKSITEKLGRPLVATSANIADAGESYSAVEVAGIFKNRKFQPDIILDYGVLVKRMPTTIVSVAGGELKVLRQGDVVVENDKEMRRYYE